MRVLPYDRVLPTFELRQQQFDGRSNIEPLPFPRKGYWKTLRSSFLQPQSKMPAQTTTVSPSPAGDDLDDLFNYDVETDDVFRDYNPAMDAPVRSTSPARPKTTDLGIDEEIQITKKRKPIAKLDENRQVIPRNRSAVYADSPTQITIPSRDTQIAAHHEGAAEVQGQRPRGMGFAFLHSVYS